VPKNDLWSVIGTDGYLLLFKICQDQSRTGDLRIWVRTPSCKLVLVRDAEWLRSRRWKNNAVQQGRNRATANGGTPPIV
jgi:hypothetical protein